MDSHQCENMVRDPEIVPVYGYCPDHLKLLVEQRCRVLKAGGIEGGEELTGLKAETDTLERKDILGTRAHIDQTSPTGWVLEKEGPVTGVELLHKALPPSTSACTGTTVEGKYLPVTDSESDLKGFANALEISSIDGGRLEAGRRSSVSSWVEIGESSGWNVGD
ncbi:hypothetical protein OIDMADRAFT_60250 [Oidiodendron maius Zn]|uniref:Uncharacterized protein n=1 Tax=Oidiodendron maius (strain Zn) TaxID=913774 RepID=A0A0C3GV28_OIDMZ|nr:hypothetical protein OIDMADRAFT_60250 [Oidiodendron maius Zn]